MDILSVYCRLFHQRLSARLTALAACGLQTADCSYLLFWVNHCYPQEILNHEELKGKIQPACLGPLLLQEHLDRLEDQYLSHKQDQVLDSSLTECSCVLGDQRKAQRLTAHLENFLSSYRKCVEAFVKGKHGNGLAVIKAQLVCEQQLRDYITGETGSLSEPQRRGCLDTLAALKDCGYRCLTCPIHLEMKVCFSHLLTPGWTDGSLPVVDSLLSFIVQELTDLKPTCRQYVRRMMKMKTVGQQDGAERTRTDALKICAFFGEGGVSRDPDRVQQEVLRLTRSAPPLSDAHLSALLCLCSGQSDASVDETRLLAVSTNQSSAFFFGFKVKWIHKHRK
ncbi:Tumor necrosis factor alpha-induced protein 2 [Dissostichus eleginoides]|uniref:Tumor necrosis factor alpha-induced protein 2 n=1 Tax=Dissostichus eleginoides TaxID=100907 RepID=A0AAD9B375_DISEL|nr:Tumor necrosis factor alpha-induced protein 2 [Dissostichus eleginoides]